MPQRKIGIFAGSFDPVHNGHLAAATVAAEQLDLAAVYFVVEPRPRYKQGVKSFEHRSEMVRLAVEDNPNFKQIIIDEPYCTTEDTIPMLKNRFPGNDLYLLIGDDVARRIADWSQTATLFDSVILAILQRNMQSSEITAIFDKLEAVSGRRPHYELVKNKPLNCSSSEVKRQLKSGVVPKDCLNSKVVSYMQKHNIYGSSGLAS